MSLKKFVKGTYVTIQHPVLNNGGLLILGIRYKNHYLSAITVDAAFYSNRQQIAGLIVFVTFSNKDTQV